MIATSSHQFTHRNPASGIAGEATCVIDWEAATARTRATGFWEVAQAKAFFAEYVGCIRALHRRGKTVRGLVDLRESAPQSLEVAEILRSSLTGLYRAGDRMAMVVPNSLVKMQLKRVLTGDAHDFFLALDTAEAWAFGDR